MITTIGTIAPQRMGPLFFGVFVVILRFLGLSVETVIFVIPFEEGCRLNGFPDLCFFDSVDYDLAIFCDEYFTDNKNEWRKGQA